MYAFKRSVEIQVGKPGDVGKRLQGLQVEFRVDHSPTSEPSRATLSISNPAEGTIALLERTDVVVRIIAGYVNATGLIFEGEPVADSVRLDRRGGDRVLTVQLQDGGREWRDVRFDRSYRLEVTASQVLKDATAAMGMPVVRAEVGKEMRYPQGMAFHGYASEALDRLARDTKSRWFIRDRCIYFFDVETHTNERAPVISVAAGNLVGTPIRKDNGVIVTAFMLPHMRPGRRFQLESERVNGTFRARDVSFIGASEFGQPFYVEMVGDPVGVKRPRGSVGSVTGGSPQRANPDLADAIHAGAEAAASQIPTSLPGKVIEYDHDTQKAVIQPILQIPRTVERVAGIEYSEKIKLPPIPGVPVAFPQAGDFSITFPVAVGSVGMLVFAERSMDEYLAVGDTDVEPQSDRQHHRNDAWFVPSVRSFNTPIPSAGVAAGAMVLRAEEIRLGSSGATKWVAVADDVLTRLNAIESKMNSHTHSFSYNAGTAGLASSATASTSSMTTTTLADIKSDKVKTE